MKLKVLSWNVRRAKKESPVWELIAELNPDIITLQEVTSIPESIQDIYAVKSINAIYKDGQAQKFSTVILAKGEISALTLKSDLDWVNKELEFFKGNLVSATVEVPGYLPINVISVYAPAWPIDDKRLENIDVSSVKLKQHPKVWCSDMLWSALKNIPSLKEEAWIVGGDFNSSVTFDYMWSGPPSGNQEIIDRFNALGLTECLKTFTGELTPTFRNPRGGKVIHQLDHVYVTDALSSALTNSYAGDAFDIFENSLSDHLPIISEFEFKGT